MIYVYAPGVTVEVIDKEEEVTPPPTPQGPPFVLQQMANIQRLQVIFAEWSPAFGRYSRAQGLQRLSGATAKLAIYGYNTASGGTFRNLLAPEYALMIDGESHWTASPRPTDQTVAVFVVDATKLTKGWHEVTVQPSTATGECCIPYSVLVVHDGDASGSTYTPVHGANYYLQQGTAPLVYGKAPAVYAPTPRPLIPRKRTPFDTMLHASSLHVERLVPMRVGDAYRVCKTPEGALTSFSIQPYGMYQLATKYPHGMPLLDGPRGVGTVCMATHLEVGTADIPGLGVVNNLYFCDPWRLGKIRPNGDVVTLAGWRHRGIGAHWQNKDPIDPNLIELVGDWSEIPVERHGFHLLWGCTFDRRHINELDESRLVDRDGVPTHPHAVPPAMYVADSLNNRICKLAFAVDTHAPPKVTELIIGLANPWDVVSSEGVLYVSERKAHRICAYDMDTGAFLRVVVQGKAMASRIEDSVDTAFSTATLEQRRSADCVAPEGLFIQDGYLYFGSLMQAQVRRLPLAGGPIEVVEEFSTDTKSAFCKFAVSDGSFGPRGTVSMAFWTNLNFGWPTTLYKGVSWGPDISVAGVMAGVPSGFTYVSAVAFGGGQMFVGGADEGIMCVTKRLPTDGVVTNSAIRGSQEYHTKGLNMIHGTSGFGFYGLPLPWGESADMDAYLKYHGHTQRESRKPDSFVDRH